MPNRKAVLVITFVFLFLILLAFLYFKIVKINKPQDIDLSNNQTSASQSGETSPFADLSVPLEEDDTDKILNDRMARVDCNFPVDMQPSLGSSMIVPGIKDDATSNNDYWILYTLQPVVLGYATLDEINYFIGGLKDDSGSCKKIAFVLTGVFDVEDESGLLDESTVTNLDGNKLSFEEFVVKYPIGSQVKVFYMGSKQDPEFLTSELCNYKPPLSQRYCSIQRVSDIFSETIIDIKLLSGIFRFPSDSEQIYVVFIDEVLPE